jgi:hypothetical protein
MSEQLPWIKPKPWNGKGLKGTWAFTIKIDGVQARFTEAGWQSRAGKPLYNLNAHVRPVGEIYEVFNGVDWDTTVGLVRRSKNGCTVPQEFLYQLWPVLDDRLKLKTAIKDPTVDYLSNIMKAVVAEGYEGLVLVNLTTGERLKIKPKETYDVAVTGIIEGTGKHKGRMGALMTTKGKVGTGFSDVQRQEMWDRCDNPIFTPIIGSLIEVDCMGITKAGKFRHPRFIRERFDKSTESSPNESATKSTGRRK